MILLLGPFNDVLLVSGVNPRSLEACLRDNFVLLGTFSMDADYRHTTKEKHIITGVSTFNRLDIFSEPLGNDYSKSFQNVLMIKRRLTCGQY